jgi:hypothetical protein
MAINVLHLLAVWVFSIPATLSDVIRPNLPKQVRNEDSEQWLKENLPKVPRATWRGLEKNPCAKGKSVKQCMSGALMEAVIADRAARDGTFTEGMSRRLAAFNALNSMLEPIEFTVGPIPQIEKSGWKVDIWKVVCGKFSIGNMIAQSTRRSPEVVDFELQFHNFGLHCSIDMSYEGMNGFIDGDSGVDMSHGADNRLTTAVRFLSQTPYGVPMNASLPHCTPNINLGFSFSGSYAGMLNLFGGMVEGIVNGVVNSMLCSELQELGAGQLSDVLVIMSDSLSPYLTCQPGEQSVITINATGHIVTRVVPQCNTRLSVLDPKLVMELPPDDLDSVDLVDYNQSSIFGYVFLDKVRNSLEGIASEELPNGTVRKDLKANILVRSMLGGSGQLNAPSNISILSGGSNESASEYWDLEVRVVNASISGLDSFRHVSSVKAISKYTLDGGFSLKNLDINLVIQISMKPKAVNMSLLNSSNLSVTVGDSELDHSIDIRQRIHGLTFRSATYVPFNWRTAGDIEVGQVFANPVGCFMTGFENFTFKALAVFLEDLENPLKKDEVHDGVNAFVNGLSDALFVLIKEPMIKAFPNFVATKGKEILNSLLFEKIKSMAMSCPPPVPLDFTPSYFRFNESTEFKFVKEQLDGSLGLNGSNGEPDAFNEYVAETTQVMNPDGKPGVVIQPNLICSSSCFRIFKPNKQ